MKPSKVGISLKNAYAYVLFGSLILIQEYSLDHIKDPTII